MAGSRPSPLEKSGESCDARHGKELLNRANISGQLFAAGGIRKDSRVLVRLPGRRAAWWRSGGKLFRVWVASRSDLPCREMPTMPRCPRSIRLGSWCVATAILLACYGRRGARRRRLVRPGARADRQGPGRSQYSRLSPWPWLTQGKIVWEQGFGWADRENRVPASEHTLYSVASVSKPITATGLMVLGRAQADRPRQPDQRLPGRREVAGPRRRRRRRHGAARGQSHLGLAACTISFSTPTSRFIRPRATRRSAASATW